VEFRVLGPLEVVAHGRVLPLGGTRQRALLALLLTCANEVVSADRLIDELWGAEPPGNAPNALHYHVSQLRKALGRHDAVVTQEPGYTIPVGPEELDLLRFELLVQKAEGEQPELAARSLREALALWRGPALADLAQESFAQLEVLRLEELRLAALERRFEADLALGCSVEIVSEVQALVREHPYRERPRASLMHALYASGRQAEALEVYRETRRLLVDELGIEPSPALQALEQAILRHDPSLSRQDGPTAPRQGSIMLIATDPGRLDDLLAIAKPLARRPARELILARLLRDNRDLAAASSGLSGQRNALVQEGVSSRTAVFTTDAPGTDAVRLATEHEVDLVLLDADRSLIETGRPDRDLATVLQHAPCDTAVLFGRGHIGAGPVVTPFGGAGHEWAAIELAAWLAHSLGTTLRLLGTDADPVVGRRDASRLLSRASMLVQKVVGIDTEPVLIRPGHEGVLEAARDASLLVVGLPERWTTEGIGPARLAVATEAGVPTLFVRRGLRPGGLAPSETLTRFTWTLESERPASPDVTPQKSHAPRRA
jgi:DNA-binding SARP family transcriptional activator